MDHGRVASSQWLTVGASLAGMGCVAWALAGSWRNADGVLTSAVCFPIVCGVSAFAIAAAARTTYRNVALWFAVAAIAQAATLQMIDAGWRLHYQHYRPLTSLASTHPWLLVLLGVQTLIVAVALARQLPPLVRSTRQKFPIWRLVAALALSVCTAATVSPEVSRYAAELGFAIYVQVLAIATIALMALAMPSAALQGAELRLNRILGQPGEEPAGQLDRRDYFGWIAAGLTTTIAAMLSVLSYGQHPHVPDEVVYLYHAKYFAEGMLTMTAPPVPAAFDVDLMHYESTRWFSPVPPGWPAVLAIGMRAGVPWLVNPLIAGICVLLIHTLLLHLYSRRVARYATALLALSPWFLFLAMSFMTHMLVLAFALTAAIAVVSARGRGTFGRGFLAGSAVGATSLVRPLDGVIVGVLIALWSLGVGGNRLRLRSLSGVFAGTLIVGALAFPYNWMLTGAPLQFPINAYVDKYYGKNTNAYGFGPDRGMGWPIDPNPGHGPLDALINANLNTFGLNTDLFGWSTGSLIFIAFLLCSANLKRPDHAMVTAVAVVFVTYFFYYFSGGPDFGARYWFVMVVPLVALTARGIQALESVAGARVGVAVAGLMAMSVINFVPWRAIDKYVDFRGMRADVRTLAVEHGWTDDLVLIRGKRDPDYASAVGLNPIDLTSPATIYAWDRNAAVRAATLRAYPNRRVWLVDGPTITGSKYRVVRGPVPEAVLSETGTSK